MMPGMMDYRQILKTNGISLIYNGPLWSEGIESIAGTLRKRLEFDKLPLPVSQSVFSVFVEQVNNMLMYSAEKEAFTTLGGICIESPKGTFVWGIALEDKKYFIQTGNVMKNENVEMLKNKIDYLNTLDKAGLRKYYKEQIRLENNNPESKGAGLGFIEIAKRISSKIIYSFTPYDENSTYFATYVTIGEGN